MSFMFDLNLMRSFGVNIKEDPGWQARGNGALEPIGIMIHHDVDPKPDDPNTPGVENPGTLLHIIRNGRAGLPGPLANFYHQSDGVCVVVAARRANHAGMGSSVVLRETQAGVAPSGDARDRGLADDTSVGNRYYIGIEVEHAGTHGAYTDLQINSLVDALAALCTQFNLSPNSIVHHREWSRRKIDMSYRGDIRGKVAARLAPVPVVPPVEPEALKMLSEGKMFYVKVPKLVDGYNHWFVTNEGFCYPVDPNWIDSKVAIIAMPESSLAQIRALSQKRYLKAMA